MIKFTSLFVNNLCIEFSPMLSSSLTSFSGVYTSMLASEIYQENTILGTLLTSTGSTIVSGLDNAYNKTVSQLQDTQAYVESLTEEELSELINKLETKDYSCETVEESVVVKKKQFN